MSITVGNLSRSKSGGQRLVTLRLTKSGTVGLLLFLQIAALGSVAAGWVGADIPLFRPVLTVVYLSVLPGFLLLRIIGIKPSNVTDTLLYAVGLSLTVLMFYGVTVNLVLRATGYSTPISEEPMVLATGALTLALTGLYYVRRDDPETYTFAHNDVVSPVFPFLLLLPLLGIYGAYVLNVYTENLLILLLFAAIGGVVMLVYTGIVSRALIPLAVWMIALALLFQNTLTGSFLAWGDSVTEADHVLQVLEDGYWSPAVTDARVANQYTLLRLTVLHPVYYFFTGLELVWVFKIIHPLLFSLMPVALYQAYKRFVTAKAAFFAAFFVMSLFSFFVVLSRNTRTGIGLFFLALFLVPLLNDRLAGVHRQLLAMLFVSSLVVSHYGTSYILFSALLLAMPAFLVANRLEALTGLKQRLTRPSWTVTSLGFVGFYVAVTLSWYIYASPESASYREALSFGGRFITTLVNEFTGYGQSASIRVATENWGSSIIAALQYYHFVLGPLIAVGILGAVLRSIGILEPPGDGSIVESLNREFVILAGIFLAIFGATFLPIQRINTARTFAIALVFLAPFLVLGVAEIGRVLGRLAGTTPSVKLVLGVVAGIVLLYFLLNSGFISAVAVGEYSPNTLVEKDRITEAGHPVEQNYFYKQHPTVYQVEGTVWLRTHASPNETVYHGHWPGGIRSPIGYESYRTIQQEYVPIRGASIPRDGTVGSGYVFLGSLEYRGNIVAHSPGQFGFVWDYRSDLEHAWNDKDRIYHNGESVIRY